MKRIIALLALSWLAGCSTAGPFVTSISSDGAGGIVVEKCMVHHNDWTRMIGNSDCTSSNIRLTK